MMSKCKKSIITFEDLPDTIGVKEYMQWRACGRATADAIFHSKDFPRIPNTGNKLLADKRAVLLYELNLDKSTKEEILKEMFANLLVKNDGNEITYYTVDFGRE